MDLTFKSIQDFEIKAVGDDVIITGYGAVFGNVDSYGDIITPGAFSKTLEEMKGRIAFCYQHDIYNPIGKIQEIKEDAKGLWIKVRISDAEPEIKQKLKEGILKEMSIGFRTIKSDDENGIRYLKEIALYEISLVTIAANDMATVDQIKAQFGEVKVDEEFDRLILNERNHNKKFELMKLKHIVSSLLIKEPEAPTPPSKPETVVTNLSVKFKIE